MIIGDSHDLPPGGEQPSSQGNAGRLARGSILLLTSGVAAYSAAIGLNILLARQLGANGFGAWAVAFSLSLTIATSGLMGADWIVQRHGSYYQGIGDIARLRKTIHLALALSGAALAVIAVAMFWLAPFVARDVFHEATMLPLLRLSAVAIPIMGVGQMLLLGTRAFKSMRESALIRNIVQPLVRLASVAIALLISPNELSAFVGLVVAEIATTCAAGVALHRRLPLWGPTDKIAVRSLVRFALPAWGTRVIENSRGQVFPVLLGSLVTLSASGAFVASRQIAVVPTAIIAAINTAYTPMVGDLFLQGRREEFTFLFKGVGKWAFSMGFPIFCFEVLFSSDLLLLFGSEFSNANTALVVLAVGMLFNFATGPVTRTLMIAGRTRLALLDYILVVVTEITLSLLLIPRLGLLGAAVANAVGTAINNALPLWQVWRLMGLHPYRWDYWKPISAGLASALIAKFVLVRAAIDPGPRSAFFAAMIIGVSYLGLLMLLGLSPDDREIVQGLVKRARSRKQPRRANEEEAEMQATNQSLEGTSED